MRTDNTAFGFRKVACMFTQSHDAMLVNMFICRFKAQDMEVQLSDELAGSLRQLKVRHELCFLAHPLALPVRTQSLSVMSFGSFSWCIIFSPLYCLILSFILFSNTVTAHFPSQGSLQFHVILLLVENSQLFFYLLPLCPWIILKSVFVAWMGFYNLGGNCARSQNGICLTCICLGWALSSRNTWTPQPEGSVLKDRFKSLQKRNLIEPRERAK